MGSRGCCHVILFLCFLVASCDVAVTFDSAGGLLMKWWLCILPSVLSPLCASGRTIAGSLSCVLGKGSGLRIGSTSVVGANEIQTLRRVAQELLQMLCCRVIR